MNHYGWCARCPRQLGTRLHSYTGSHAYIHGLDPTGDWWDGFRKAGTSKSLEVFGPFEGEIDLRSRAFCEHRHHAPQSANLQQE